MKKISTLFVALLATTALWASNVITYTAISQLNVNTNAFNVAITSHTFADSIGTITFAGEVTSIGGSAFGECTSLISISIPNSVTSIGSGAFGNCTSLTSISIPNSVTSIGYMAFSYCTSLISINVDASNTYYASIDGVLFNYAKNTLIQYPVGNSRKEYAIPASVTKIGDGAFFYCSSLTSISIPNSVTSIGGGAFSDCNGLTTITIPNGVTSIERYTFSECHSLTSINIPNRVTSIGEGAFSDCRSLTSVSIPNSVTSIGDEAFYQCRSLTSFSVDAANTHYSSIDGVLFNYAKDTLIQYSIGNTRTSYTIPNGVTNIGDYAFKNCRSLTSITIPNSVTSIEDKAFCECRSLTSFTCYAINPPICRNCSCFSYIDKSIPLYVPAESISAYQVADEWEDFTNIQAIAAKEVVVTEIESEPDSTSVEIAWPAVSGSDNYTIVVKQGEKEICTIVFNAQGQMLSINFAASAPARGSHYAQAAVETSTGWAYTITGLNPGTAYTYSVVAKDAQGNTIDTKNGSFETTGTTAIDQVDSQKSRVKSQKFFRNGVLIIERNGKTYNVQGAKVE